MTGPNGAAPGSEDRAPTELELLLPFHAAGTLNARDARRVEEALARDPALARQYAAIQEEFAETILLNESLGAPSARPMQKLFAAIDAEPRRAAAPSLSARIAGVFAGLSPRALAAAGVVALLAIVLQAGIIGTLMMERPAALRTASSQTPAAAGPVALIRFAPDADIAAITAFLDAYRAAIIDGPRAGMFRVRFGDAALPEQEAAQLLARVRQEKVVGLAVAAD